MLIYKSVVLTMKYISLWNYITMMARCPDNRNEFSSQITKKLSNKYNFLFYGITLYQFAWSSITKYRLVGLNNRNVFSRTFGARSLKPSCQHSQCVLRPLLLACKRPSSHCLHNVFPSIHVCVQISTFKNSSHIGLNIILMTSF